MVYGGPGYWYSLVTLVMADGESSLNVQQQQSMFSEEKRHNAECEF